MKARDEWFGMVTANVAFDPTISVTAKAVYMALVMYRNVETDECYPKNETLAEHLGASERTLIRALNELVDAGVICRVSRFVDGRQINSATVLSDARATRHRPDTPG